MNKDLYLYYLNNFINIYLKKELIINNNIDTYFKCYLYQTLRDGDIPESESVTHLQFEYYFNQELNNNNIPIKLIEIIIYNNYIFLNSFVNTNNNIFIGIMNHNRYFINYKKYFMEIDYNDKLDFNKFISNINIIGKIIFKELVEKIFHPNRLLKICDKYNINFTDINDYY